MKFVMECVARGISGMSTEMSGAKYEPGGRADYSEQLEM